VTGKEKKLTVIAVALFLILFSVIDLVTGMFLIPRSYNEFRIRDTWYHHGLKRNVSSQAVWGPIIYPFYTNSLGFRDFSVRDVPVHSENRRILILGDSHSEGVGIDYQYTFSGILQIEGEKRGVEILNASAVSYSPKIHYLKGDYLINQLGLKVDELWVIIDISDLQNEIAYEKFIPSKQSLPGRFTSGFLRFLRQNSFTVHSIHTIRENKEIKKFNETLLGFREDLSHLPSENAIELYREFFRHFDNEELIRDPNFHGVSEWIYKKELRELADQGLELGFENISKLYAICRDNGIKMRLSVHPWQTQVLKGDTTDYYVERWRSYCESEGIHFINLYPLFINHENPLWVAKTCYIEGDNHWNERGNARVAEYLKRYLDK
jgi:hypothetical protein